MAISVLITTISAGCIGIISQIQHSRCVKLRICFGLCDCVRNVPDVEEPTVSLEKINKEALPLNPHN